jgi:hypothetical protein
MPKFQVEATLTATGYIEIEAPDAKTARERIQRLDASVDFGTQWDIDTALFDRGLNVHVDGVNAVEDESAEVADAKQG